MWTGLARITHRGPAAVIIAIALVLGVFGAIEGHKTPIGDTQAGVPELRADSRYNRDSNLISSRFSVGTDIINVIVETKPDGCIDFRIIDAIDRFAWHMANVEGVRDVMSLAGVSKVVSAGWSEGSLKWRNLPHDERQLVQAQNYIETSTGLLNRDCSVMPVMLFLSDHRAETIERVVAAVKEYRAKTPTADVTYRLATGNVGVMAAQNEEVKAKEFVILGWVFAAVTIMCLVNFRSVVGTIMVIVPLALVSILVYAVMAFVGIGLKVNTLPMVALGAGIGVDYGIYLFSRMQEHLRPRPQRALRVSRRAPRHGRGDLLHGHHARARRRDLGVLAAQVPGGRRPHADVHVPGEHAGRDAALAGAGGVAAAEGEIGRLVGRPGRCAAAFSTLRCGGVCRRAGAPSPRGSAASSCAGFGTCRACMMSPRAARSRPGGSLPGRDGDAPRSRSRRSA